MNLGFKARSIKEQRNYRDFSRHAQNIEAVPRKNENNENSVDQQRIFWVLNFILFLLLLGFNF